IGDDILRNPTQKEVDSTLRAYKKTDIDSVAVVAISSDSAYTFPLSNYPSSLAESRVAGDNNQLSEVTRQSDEKVLYKMKIDENTLRNRNVSATPTAYAKKLMRESRLTKVNAANGKVIIPASLSDTAKKQNDFFQNEFGNDTTTKKVVATAERADLRDDENVLARAKLFVYKPKKFSADYGSAAFTNSILVNRYQSYQDGQGPVMLTSSTPLNGLVRLGTSDLMEDIKINGAFKIGTNLKDNEWLLNYQNLKRRIDWGLTYYRNTQSLGFDFQRPPVITPGTPPTVTFFLPVFVGGKQFSNLYQANISYPFDVTKSIRFSTGIRSDNRVVNATSAADTFTLKIANDRTLYQTSHLEFVYDNSVVTAMNIYNGARAKIYGDFNRQINKVQFANGPNTYNIGFDARYYYPIYKNFIWAGRAAGDFSFGNQKLIYYLGGVDGWLMFGGNTKKDGTYKYFASNNLPANDQDYAFQSLAVNMRGYIQNIASGNNALVINSEFRLPVFTTLFDKTINNAFIRNFMVTQFIDLGTAWNGGYKGIKRPEINYSNGGPVNVRVKAGGIGPFA
ncbi:MAG: hypothetical protein H7101_06085, partial [Deinococcales bacterium]|nr:hypothetical protein [Chitinophagaceae bacterium]